MGAAAAGDNVNYDQFADQYAAHRQIHPAVLEELSRQVQCRPLCTVLEVGCGSGNYICTLARRFAFSAYGLDPSVGMLAHARAKPGRVAWLVGRAEELCFVADSLDLVFSVDVIHHLADQAAFYREAARTLRTGGRLCTVTDSAEIIRQREVLSRYFPETVSIELSRYPAISCLRAWMAAAGLIDLGVVVVQEPYELTSAQPFCDRVYSSLHLIPEAAWRAGLARLERDLAFGPVRGASRYACVWGQKPDS